MDLDAVTPRVLALNVGSSSLKAAVRGDGPVLTCTVERLGTPRARLLVDGPDDGEAGRRERPLPGADLTVALDAVLEQVCVGQEPAAVAHRFVQGGLRRTGPARVDEALVGELEALTPLAPLHQPSALQLLRAARDRLPNALHTASFDTALWRALPEVDQRLAVPEDVHTLGVQRYGFHGLSVQSVLHAVGEAGRLVVAHLGNGCSVSALRDGVPLHTSMSFTPTGGILSGTRSGDLDPSVVLYLIETVGWSAERVRETLDRRAGLAGLSGGEQDLRVLLGRRDNDAGADLALRLFVRSVAMEIAGCVAVLGGLDTLVFTGGVGEHAVDVREEICAALAPFGVPAMAVPLDATAAPEGSAPRALIVPADEQGVLDREARTLLAASG